MGRTSAINGSLGTIAHKHINVFNPSNICQLGVAQHNLSFAKRGDATEEAEVGIIQII